MECFMRDFNLSQLMLQLDYGLDLLYKDLQIAQMQQFNFTIK